MLRKSTKHLREKFVVDYTEFFLKPKVIMDTHSFEYNKIMNILDIVLKFIIENKLTLVGGMSINYSLIKASGDNIYDESEIPDYDIVTDKPVEYAYSLANILSKDFDIDNIDIIRAIHPSTVRVRYNFITLLDVTYISSEVLSEIPLLQISPKDTHKKYGDVNFVHPWYQFVDIHYALANPYENSPMETVTNRTYKDIHRYNRIYEYYPTNIDKSNSNFNLYDVIFTEDISKLINSDFLWSGFIAYEILSGNMDPDGPKVGDVIKLPLQELKILSSKNTNTTIIVNSKLRIPKNYLFSVGPIKVSIEPITKTTLYCKKYPKIVHIQELLKYFMSEHLVRKNTIEKNIFLYYYNKTRELLTEEILTDIDGIFYETEQAYVSDNSNANVFPSNVNTFDTPLKFDYTKFPWTD